jgi:GNAT superfamily N-acetyltransferase
MSSLQPGLKTRPQITPALNPTDIESCFAVFQELRPKLDDKKAFVDQVLRQINQGYTLVYTCDDEEIGACMGFRIFETLGWGKILYIDDLITREKSRKKGLASALLTYAIEQSRLTHCAEVHLDSGHHRYDAHRLYLNLGFTLNCHHLSLVL